MGQKLILAAMVLPLAACGSGTGTNPVNGSAGTTTTDGTTTTTDDGTGISSDGTTPPGTNSPSASSGIFRYEAEDGSGSGYAKAFTYNSARDEFTIDNLAFDGDNTYTRDDEVGTLGSYSVYENASTFTDSATGSAVGQLSHKALYGVSKTKNSDGTAATEFAIVRSGGYINYGFGGFVYQRSGNVTMPTTGQAQFTGDYAALRDFTNKGGIEYATGDMQVTIDFEDFDAGDAVRGQVFNRRIFDVNGNDITNDMLAAMATEYGGTFTSLPSLFFTVTDGSLDANGEIGGTLSSYVSNNGTTEVFESGNYYALVSGDTADEIVGVLVVEAEDARADGVTVRETGGFILYRP